MTAAAAEIFAAVIVGIAVLAVSFGVAVAATEAVRRHLEALAHRTDDGPEQ